MILLAGALNIIAQTKTVFKIQVASHPREFTVERIQSDLGIDLPLTMHYIDGRYKYFYGEYASRAAAEADLNTVPVQGAWVVAVQVDGAAAVGEVVQQDLRPAEETVVKKPAEEPAQSESRTTTEGETVSEMVYRIQVAADRQFIDPERIKIEKGLSGQKLDYIFKNGYYKYFVGDFKTMAEAETYKNEVLKQGFVVLAPIDRMVVPVEAQEDAELQPEGTTDTLSQAADTVPQDSLQVTYNSQYARWIGWGDQAFATNRLTEAKGYYQQALQYDPTNQYPITQIARIDQMLEEEVQTKISKRGKIIVFIGLAFTVLLVAGVVYSLMKRTSRKKQEKRRDSLRDEIQDSVTEYLFDENATRPQHVDQLRSSRDKQVLIDEIMQLYANLSGEISNRLRELYIDLGLDNESVQKTQSPQWYIRAKGFRELAQMNIKTVNEEIEKCLNS